MTIFTESFNGPSTDLDWNIVRGTESFTFNGDGTASIVSTENEFLRAVHDVGDTDMFAETVVAADGNGTSQRVVLLLRMADDSTSYGYSCALDLDEQHFTFIHWVDGHPENENGEYIPFGVIDDPVTVPQAPFTLRFEVEGTEFRGYINGALVKTESDSQRSFGTNGGIGTQRGATFDSFRTGGINDSVSPELSGGGGVASASSGAGFGSGSHTGTGDPVSSGSAGSGSATTVRDGSGEITSGSDGSGGGTSTRQAGPISVESVSETHGAGSGTHTGGGSVLSSSSISGAGRKVYGGSVVSESSGDGIGTGAHAGAGSVDSSSSGTGEPVTHRSQTGEPIGSTSSGEGLAAGHHIGGGSVWTRSAGIGSGYAQQFAAAGITRPIVGITLRLTDDAGNPDEFLPDWTSVAFTDKYNATGTVALEYAKGGRFADRLIRDRAEGALFDGALEIPGTRFMVTQSATDGVKESAEGNTVTVNAPVFVPTRLEEARVYPPGFDPAVTHSGPVKTRFANATPGEIIGTLIALAWDRGAIGDVETDFSAALTSQGEAWEREVTLEIDPGSTILSVLKKLTEMGVCDWSSHQRVLILKNPDSGVDRTTEDDPVVLQRGRDILDAPEKRDLGGLLTTVLVIGKDGITEEVTDPALYEAHGRLEGYVSVSGVEDRGTLRVIGETTLERAKLPQVSYTHGLSLFANNGATPWVDYQVGDYVWRDVADGEAPERMRVAQLSGTYTADRQVTGAVTLGTRFDSVSQRLSARIDALTNGSDAASSAPADLPDEDGTAPAAPDGLQVSADAYTLPNGGGTSAALSASWLEVTTNEDSSGYRDHEVYRVEWRPTNLDTWIAAGTTRDAGHNWSPVPTDRLVEVRVRAEDRNGNVSAWSETVSVVTPTDSESPGVPTGVSAENWIGTARIDWTGEVLTDTGEPVSAPDDFRRAQVHVSTAGSGFAPSPETLADALTGPGRSNVNGLEPGTTYYVRLVAEDYSGNLSAPSGAVSVTPRQVVNLDLGPDAVDRANIRDAAIGSAQIDELAVNSAHIASVEAGAILTGTMEADIAIAGSFNTSSDPNNRVRMDGAGLRMTEDGQVTVRVEPGGSNFFQGDHRIVGEGGSEIYIRANGLYAAHPTIELSSPNGVYGAAFMNASDHIDGNGETVLGINSAPNSTGDYSRTVLFPDQARLEVVGEGQEQKYGHLDVSRDYVEISTQSAVGDGVDSSLLLERDSLAVGVADSTLVLDNGQFSAWTGGRARLQLNADESGLLWGATGDSYLWMQTDNNISMAQNVSVSGELKADRIMSHSSNDNRAYIKTQGGDDIYFVWDNGLHVFTNRDSPVFVGTIS